MNQSTGFDVKIERGKQHIADLKLKIAEFTGREPFSMVKDEEAATGDLVYRVRIVEQPPVQWAAIIGDAIHNLHSALDLLVWQLVLANGGIPNRGTAFPFAEQATTFAQTLAKVKGLSLEAQRHLRAAQPYPGGNDQLWRLHQLDIIDKHRLLIPVAAAHHSLVIDFAAGLRALRPEWDIPSLPLALRPAENQFPLRDNDEIYRVMAAARATPGDDKPQFRFAIVFGEGNIVQGEPLVSTLEGFAEAVEEVTKACRSLIV